MSRHLILAAMLSAILAPSPSAFAQRAACEGDGYRKGLCLYRQRQYLEAEKILTVVVAANAEDPVTLRAKYFLARTEMKLGNWDKASGHLIEIYALSPLFYKEWSCDFLLGESRKGLGEE
ncbi:MAG TPA: hypothetical protein VNM92_14720 [Thermoanaerobaculia bacterium]|nr:hypothetical protein [Thermoanaerobaculia bacterium]